MKCLRNLIACLCPALLLATGVARAETVVWSDNFDTNAASRWSASAIGVWKIGSPTAGPPVGSSDYRTHSGTDCASSQGYAYNKDVRLVCISYNGASSLTIPAADQYPRLRFWHWFNYANALGYVEISTNSGASWTQISRTYANANGGGVWSRPYLDLTGYAGLNVRIAFHFTSGGCCGNALGWFVDDVAVVTGTPSLTFPESFESDPKTSDWSVDLGSWEIGKPASGPGAAHTGTNCAATVLTGNYANNVDSRLISPPFLVPASGSPALRFWQWYNFNNALGYVELNNGSITVTTVTNTVITTNTTAALNTNSYQFFGSTDANYAIPFYWNSTIGGWTNATKALGSALDYTYGTYYFEAGNAPLSAVGGPNGADGVNVDYRPINNTIIPLPQSHTPTNFFAMQGLAWAPVNDIDQADTPTGYFGTNYTTTYTTNTTVTSGQSSWVQLSPTYIDSTSGGVWTNVSLDLSAYAGQTVFIAFHFTSGGIYTAPGWYVDDLSLAVPPQLIVPTNQIINAGDELIASLMASNSLLPNAQYTFKLLSGPAGVSLTNGVVTWQTSSNQPASTFTITVAASDNSVPPLAATNSFTVSVVNPCVLTVPATQTIYAGQTLVATVSATNELSATDTFTYALLSTAITNLDTSDLPSDGVITWPTMTTQKTGTYTIGIQAMDEVSPQSVTNSFSVVVLKPPLPVLTLPSTRTIYAGQTLDLFVSATNSAFTNSVFAYAATSSPPGVSIDPGSGELTYPTTPTNKTQSVSISVVVTDDNTPPLSATGSFKVTISNTPASTLKVPGTQTNYGGMTLSVTNSATNVALSGAVFTYRLPSPSTNFCLTTNGVLTWTNTGVRNGILIWTNDSISPGTRVITLAADAASAGVPKGLIPLSVTNQFNMVFLPPHPPSLLGSTNLTVYAGQRLVVTNIATNNYVLLTQASYTFKTVSTNVLVTTNGVLTWTNTAALPGIYEFSLKVTDNSVPPLVATNTFSVAVLPLPTQLTLTNLTFLTKGGRKFQFSIQTPWTNTPWRIEATTNLDATNWLPVYTNKTGAGGALLFTDQLATNFLQRYYRAVFP